MDSLVQFEEDINNNTEMSDRIGMGWFSQTTQIPRSHDSDNNCNSILFYEIKIFFSYSLFFETGKIV